MIGKLKALTKRAYLKFIVERQFLENRFRKITDDMFNATMMRAFLISVACITLVVFVGACSSEMRREEPVRQDVPTKFQKVKPEKQTTRGKKSSKRLGKRERYEAYASARLRDYENRLSQIRMRAMQSSGHSKQLAQRNVRKFEQELSQAQAQYNQLENAKGKSWAASKKQMDQSLDTMKPYER